MFGLIFRLKSCQLLLLGRSKVCLQVALTPLCVCWQCDEAGFAVPVNIGALFEVGETLVLVAAVLLNLPALAGHVLLSLQVLNQNALPLLLYAFGLLEEPLLLLCKPILFESCNLLLDVPPFL